MLFRSVLLALAVVARWHQRIGPGVLIGALIVMILWRVPATTRQVDASQDVRAIVYARTVLDRTPADALVLTLRDEDTFPLWYAHYAEHQRPDIAVVVKPLLEFEWYRANLRQVYPTLQVPSQQQNGWTAALVQANAPRRPICFTRLQEPVPVRCE